MIADETACGSYTRDDGFGTRRLCDDRGLGPAEVLDLTPALATPAAEQAIRERAHQLEGLRAPMIAHVYRIDRTATGLSVVGAAPDGVPLSELLAALEFGTLTLPDAAILELAATTVLAVSAMHEKLGALAHGALNPAHVLLQRDGRVILTDAVFGEALQQLDHNREELWRRYSLAMPPAATLPRFDRRTDVAQLGSVILAVMLGRTLLAHEYPRPVADLVMTATAESGPAGSCGPGLRTWLQQTLQLQPRALFPSAFEAAEAFLNILASSDGRRAGAPSLQRTIRRMCGETVAPPGPEPELPPGPQPAPVITEAPRLAPAAPSRAFSLLSAILPHLRGSDRVPRQ